MTVALAGLGNWIEHGENSASASSNGFWQAGLLTNPTPYSSAGASLSVQRYHLSINRPHIVFLSFITAPVNVGQLILLPATSDQRVEGRQP